MRSLPLRAVARFVNGVAFRPTDWGDEGLPIVRIQNLTDPTKPLNRTTRVVPDALRARPGDLLVSWSATLGVFLWPGPEDALVNQHIFRVLPDEGLVNKGYLRHILDGALTDMERHLHGATMKHVNRNDFLGTLIPVPPMEEQRRIAAILDQADALRAKRRAVASQVAALCPALFGVAFGEVFGARTRWPMVRLDDALLQIDSGTSPVCLDRPAVEDEWSVLKLGAISSLIFQPGQNKALKPGTVPNPNHEVHAGDVLFSRKNTRELVGASVYVEEAPPHLLLPDLIFRLVSAPDGPLDAVYLKAALSTRAGREALRGLSSGSAASMVNISKGRLGGLEVAAPARALQAAFANRMVEVRALQKSLSAQTRETDVLFASLQGCAFKGEL